MICVTVIKIPPNTFKGPMTNPTGETIMPSLSLMVVMRNVLVNVPKGREGVYEWKRRA